MTPGRSLFFPYPYSPRILSGEKLSPYNVCQQPALVHLLTLNLGFAMLDSNRIRENVFRDHVSDMSGKVRDSASVFSRKRLYRH